MFVAEKYIADFTEGVAAVVEVFDETNALNGFFVEKMLTALGCFRSFEKPEQEVILQALPGDAGGLGR